jgi:hypothetical protein
MRKDPARRSDMHLRGDWTPLQNLSSRHIFTFLDTLFLNATWRETRAMLCTAEEDLGYKRDHLPYSHGAQRRRQTV